MNILSYVCLTVWVGISPMLVFSPEYHSGTTEWWFFVVVTNTLIAWKSWEGKEK